MQVTTRCSHWARSTMTSRSRFAVPTVSKSNAHTKVDGVPTLSYQDEEQEGMTTTTADSTYNIVEEATLNTIETQDEQPTPFTSLVEDTVGLPYHQVNFMTGKEIRDRSKRIVLDSYMRATTTTDQNYQPRPRRLIKSARFWKVPKQQEERRKAFTFKFEAATPSGKSMNNDLFVFGTGKTHSVTTQNPGTPGKQDNKPANHDKVDTNKGPLNKKVRRKGKRVTYQYEHRQAELKTAQTKRELSKQSQKNPKNSRNEVSDITRQWLARKNNTQPVKERKRKSKGKGPKGKKRRTNYTKTQKQLKDIRLKLIRRILKRRRSFVQFKQLTTQPSRSRREASSPAARMAQMRSNKRYKPGD